MITAPKLLLVEDDAAIAGSLRRVFAQNGYDVSVMTRGNEALELAKKKAFDVVLTDFKLPGLDGLELVSQLHAVKPLLPIIVMTAHGTTETTIEATKRGAYDYVIKPFEVEELLDLINKAVATARIATQPVNLGEHDGANEGVVGKSRPMLNLYKEIGRVAAKPVTVLIRGETGTGKELIARAIYQHSDLAGKPFIAINCNAIPETLLESELFGHERGAFTGAETRRIGRFEQAHDGTIFLDEIGDLGPGTQAKLLRVLQDHCIQRLGGKEDIPLNIRVIAATNRDLEKMIAAKEFREDLYYRLSVVVITAPPLRERRDDIPLLVHYFLRRHGPQLGLTEPSIKPDAVAFLQEYPWPGNVRELENVMRKAMLLARGYTISCEDIKSALERPASALGVSDKPLPVQIAEALAAAGRGEITGVQQAVMNTVERQLYAQAIAQAGGNLTRAAKWLGITRLTLREKLSAHGLRSDR